MPYNRLTEFYQIYFSNQDTRIIKGSYIGDQEKIRKLSAFFFWGAWVCSAERPGKSYSYTHNWPYDPRAGNLPETPVIFWTIIGSLGLVIGFGVVLFYHGRLEKLMTAHSLITQPH